MSDKKNVAIFIDSLGGGGAERVMLNLAKGLVQEGHYAHIFCLEARQDYEVPEGIPVSVLYSDRSLKKIARGRYIKPSVVKLRGVVDSIELINGRFNLFLSNLDPTNAVVSQCDFRNTYYVLHSAMEHEIAREKRLGPIKWFKKLKAKKVMSGKKLIAVSEGVAREAKNLGVVKPASVVTIYNPIDIDRVSRLSSEVVTGVPSEPYLLHVARVVKAKRHDVLMKALSHIPDIKMVLLCKDVEKVRSIARKYGVEDRVVTPGFTLNPYVWMKGAEVMVLSSDYEGLGMVLLESLVCGTPIVSTDCNYGPNEILTGDMASYLSPCGDEKALAKNVNRALQQKPDMSGMPILAQVTMNKAVQQYLALAN
jgi:glycosyltransferase involved in cell wall biosynthesis